MSDLPGLDRRRATITVIEGAEHTRSPRAAHYRDRVVQVLKVHDQYGAERVTRQGWPDQILVTTASPRGGLETFLAVEGSIVYTDEPYHLAYLQVRAALKRREHPVRPSYRAMVKVAEVLTEQGMSPGAIRRDAVLLTPASLDNLIRWAEQ